MTYEKSPITFVKITGLSHEGRGIARLNGKVVFVDGALLDEEVNFVYTRKRSGRDEGKMVEVLQPSPDRVEPQCPHFCICGGCSLQHMNHVAQLALKQKTLLEQLAHFGGMQLDAAALAPPIVGNVWGYRHKARLSVKFVEKKNKLLIGFHEKNGRYIADIDSCAILHPSVGQNLELLRACIMQLSNYRHIPQIEVAVSDDEIAIIIRHLVAFHAEDLEKLQAFGKAQNWLIYLQPGNSESIHCINDADPHKLLTYRLTPEAITPANLTANQQILEFRFNPQDFTQVNYSVNYQMVRRVLEWLEPNADDVILDLFCGLGNFTLPLALHCKQVIGVEGNAAMVLRAEQNAIHNQLQERVKFYAADLAKPLNNAPWINYAFNKILLDPPRTGALEIIQQLPTFSFYPSIEKIVYVSCNPATLARDAKELAAQGFRLLKIGIVDMFPHTKHTEVVALFGRNTASY
jgi:23S rRNA (uracil1939-C5)-methyltransferase